MPQNTAAHLYDKRCGTRRTIKIKFALEILLEKIKGSTLTLSVESGKYFSPYVHAHGQKHSDTYCTTLVVAMQLVHLSFS